MTILPLNYTFNRDILETIKLFEEAKIVAVESTIEKYFVRKAKENGAWVPKLTSPGTRGMPDRLVFRFDGGIEFVELKKEGEQLRPSQKVIKRRIENTYGQTVTVIDSKKAVDEFWRGRGR